MNARDFSPECRQIVYCVTTVFAGKSLVTQLCKVCNYVFRCNFFSEKCCQSQTQCCVLSNSCIFSWLRLGLCSSSDGHYSISSSFICPLFTVITLAQFLFTRSVYLFPGSSLRHSLFFASSPFSCGEPRAFFCYSVFCYARARQEFAFEFHLRNFHLFSGS